MRERATRRAEQWVSERLNGEAGLQADTRAYTAFLRHIREVDSDQRTVIMIQLQNEVGLIGDSRDRQTVQHQLVTPLLPGPSPFLLTVFFKISQIPSSKSLHRGWPLVFPRFP